jgi:3-hydroxybutyrate dehydrogenase
MGISEGKAAVMTGSTSGIGLACASAFASAGADIVRIGAPAEVENERFAIENNFGVKSVYSPAESNASACEPARIRDRRTKD